MARRATNNAVGQLTTDITSIQISITLGAGQGATFATLGVGDIQTATLFDAATKLVKEIIHITARSGDTLTILRAQEGTIAQPFIAGDFLSEFATAAYVNSVAFIDQKNTFTQPQVIPAATVSGEAVNLGQVASLLPVGGYMDFGGTTPPANFLVRPPAQTIVPISSYPLLFAAVLTAFGGDGVTTFGLPYLPVDYVDLGTAGGTVGSVSVGSMPAHAHQWTQPNHANYNGLATGYAGFPVGSIVTTSGQVNTSGPNLAAGIRCLKCVRYQ